MKNKIAVKLALFSAGIMIVFTLLIALLFSSLYNNYTLKLNRDNMIRQASAMSDTISELLTDSEFPSRMGMHGMGMMNQNDLGNYLNHIGDIVSGDVWVVDEDNRLIQSHGHHSFQYADLPSDGQAVIASAFTGQTSISEDFSSLLKTPTITVGTPILSDHQILGVLLLHSPVAGIASVTQGTRNLILISGSIALLLTLVIASLLSFTMTRSLNQMKKTANLLIEGDYSARTEVKSDDEIGELAHTLDILGERLEKARQQSEEFEKAREEFLTTISHELKTPVTVITGSLQALHDKVVSDPEMIDSYHKQMLKESQMLERLVNDLLDISRLQNTDFKMEKQPVNVSDLLNDVVFSAQQLAKTKDIQVNLTVDKPTTTLWGDYGRLRQMFLIVLDNAIKFSNTHSSIEIIQSNHSVSITDYGIGITSEDIPHLFDRFFQVKPNEYGTGLGLAIAKEIANRHDIEIEVKSDEKTSFIFKIST